MTQYSPAWPHGILQEVFPNIFFVTGTNITHHEGVELQHSCNMVIVKDGDALTLINTVRLTDIGLAELDKLGQVKNIVKIGSFHGRHDAFYLDRYPAKLWALKGMQHEHGKTTDVELSPNSKMPFKQCDLFLFESAKYPEAILHIKQEGGILISCDSIKNWVRPDPFFSESTIELYQKSDFFGTATISKVWKEASKVRSSDFERLKLCAFKHLLSAHGEPLFNEAYEKLALTIKSEFGM